MNRFKCSISLGDDVIMSLYLEVTCSFVFIIALMLIYYLFFLPKTYNKYLTSLNPFLLVYLTPIKFYPSYLSYKLIKLMEINLYEYSPKST